MTKHNAIPELFTSFPRQTIIADGSSVYDFLGGSVKGEYKFGWDKNCPSSGREITPPFPGLNEWTIDWVACLLAAKLAKDCFRVIELGAGYGHWAVASVLAFKSISPKRPASVFAVEADKTHFNWLEENIQTNLGRFHDVSSDLRHAAAGLDGVISFPFLTNPAEDYGASYNNSQSERFIEVPCYSLSTVFRNIGNERANLLHCDIQGAEADLIAQPGFGGSMKHVDVALFGTHRSDDLHNQVVDTLINCGFRIAVEWPRNSAIETTYGQLQTNDGAVLAIHSDLFGQANRLTEFEHLQGKVVEPI
ncbi:MAG: FkbM family methyltransferase [Verrucomicrobiota bacterium]